MSFRPLLALLLLAASFSVASAQELETYQQRQSDLATLAGLFGELHHLRRTCDPSFEADVWRERMKKMIDLEEPQASEREALVQEFNKGYRAAQSLHPACDRRARDYAAARASQGDIVVARLTTALRASEGEVFSSDGVNSPYVITTPSGVDQ